nr:hypothetical protein [Streptomyces hyaluromycini]
MSGLRDVAASFVVPGPTGVAIRDRLKALTSEDEKLLRLVGDHLGALASRDLKARCSARPEHDSVQWAQRKRFLTGDSSSRWAGSITKATHDQWALARRGRLAHIHSLQAGVRTIAHRLSLPVGEQGSRHAPGGYRSRQEWFAKSRRLNVLEDRLQAARADWQAGIVHVVRGGNRLLTTRHDAAAVAIGRRALGHPSRRRTAPPRDNQSDRYGHRTVQARPDTPGCEGHRPRIPGPRTRSVPPGRGANAVDQNAHHRSGRSAEHESWQQDSLPLSP